MNELNRNDWKMLYKNGLITASGIKNWKDKKFDNLNGFVNTTDLADKMIISKYWDCSILIGSVYYTVRYKSGCFYPLWCKNKPFKNTDSIYKLINKDIIKVKNN